MYSVSSVDYLFHTDGHGGMSASERGGYCLSSELKRNLDGGSLAVQRLNSFDYLSADVRQMLYGFSSVSNLFSICGLSFFHGGHGWTRRGINENENNNVHWRVCSVRKRTVW